MIAKKALFTCVLVVCSIATAAPVTSISSGTWTTPSIWSSGTVPTSTDQPWIANGTTVTIDSAITTGSGQNVIIGDWTPSNGTLTITSTGSLALTLAGISVGVGGNGVLNINGGSLNAPYGLNCSYYGTGIVNITAGRVDAGAIYVGVASGGNGTLNIHGGVVKSWGEFKINHAGGVGHVDINGGQLIIPGTVTDVTTYGNITACGGSCTFVYDPYSQPGFTVITDSNSALHSPYALSITNGNWTNPSVWSIGAVPTTQQPLITCGKTVTVDSGVSISQNVSVGWWDSGSGQLEISSTGSLMLVAAGMNVGAGNNGQVNIDGGTLNCPYGLNIGYSGTGNVTITGGRIDAGALYIGYGSGGNGTLDIQGGVVKCWGSGTFVLSRNSGTGHVNIEGGQLIISGVVTDVTTYGDVKAFGGKGIFAYDTVSDPGCTIVTAQKLDLDLYFDGKINFADFAKLAQSWKMNNTVTMGAAQEIDDFESYADATALQGKWIIATASTGTPTRTLITQPPYQVFQGTKALRYTYDNAIPAGSWSEIILHPSAPIDLSGYDQLILRGKRAVGNSAEDLAYVKFLSTTNPDGQVDIMACAFLDGATSADEGNWTQWVIDLHNLYYDLQCGGDAGLYDNLSQLTDVQGIMFGTCCGVGTGQGTIDLDDIKIAKTPICSSHNPADFNYDCVVDLLDLKLLVNKWLWTASN